MYGGRRGTRGSTVSPMRSRPRYQERPSALRDKLWDQGHIDVLSLFRILAWKSAKGLASATTNEPGRIEELTRKALESLLPYKNVQSPPTNDDFLAATHEALVGPDGKSGLIRLDGLRIPTASAVLSILNPAAWPIIDRWAYSALLDVTPQRASQVIGWFKEYRTYSERLTLLLPRFPGLSIHDLDQLAMNAGMRGEPFPPNQGR
jgi:hypothetical protein